MRIGIIGGGPAGYNAAIRASKRDNQVKLFEKESIGGVCVNVGCIPTKSLISSVSFYNEFQSGEQKIDWEEIQRKKTLAIKRVKLGVEKLLRENKVEIINKEAKMKKNGAIVANGDEFKFDKVILATGSKSISLPFPVPAEIWNSSDALEATEVPESIIIIGAGYIGLEFSYIFSSVGCKVAVVEKKDEVLPGEDDESVAFLRKSLMKKGIKFYLSSEVTSIKKSDVGFEVSFKKDNKEEKIKSKKVLLAIGRYPDIINLPREVLDENKKVVEVNDFLETKIKNIYAIGDCTGRYFLAHSAYKDAEIAVRNISGERLSKKEFAIPRVIYTKPELAFVGYSEGKAQSDNLSFSVTKFPFAANGKAIAAGKTTGYIKIIYTKHGKIVGGAILGDTASELISLLSLAINNDLNMEKLSGTVFPHPSFSEVVGEVSGIATGVEVRS